MSVLLTWLAQQAMWIALFCIVGAIIYALSALSARRQRDTAQFTLERETYSQRMSRSFFMAVLWMALGGIVLLVRSFVAPMLPTTAATATLPSIGLFTPTPTLPAPVGAVGLQTPTPAAPTATIEVSMQPDCPYPEAQIFQPMAGDSLQPGLIEIQGTTQMNSFSHYKFEVIYPGADNPTFIAQANDMIDNSRLGAWDISNTNDYQPGIYILRLVVADIYGNTRVCSIPVKIGMP